MILTEISLSNLKHYLSLSGISDKKKEDILNATSGKKIKVGIDGKQKFVIVTFGNRCGVAKRCTYSRKEDDFSIETGIAIACSRAMKM